MIQPLTPADLVEVSAIHRHALPNEVLPRLGTAFLERLYRAMLDSSIAFGFVVRDVDKIGGFVVGTTETSEMFRRVLRSSGPALLWRALPALLTSPMLGWRLAQAFLYPNRVAAVREEAELLIIAMREEYRTGVGAPQLVRSLNEEFRRRGICSYKLTVYDDNVRAVRFYHRLGFGRRASFMLFNRQWQIYTYDLNQKHDGHN